MISAVMDRAGPSCRYRYLKIKREREAVIQRRRQQQLTQQQQQLTQQQQQQQLLQQQPLLQRQEQDEVIDRVQVSALTDIEVVSLAAAVSAAAAQKDNEEEEVKRAGISWLSGKVFLSR